MHCIRLVLENSLQGLWFFNLSKYTRSPMTLQEISEKLFVDLKQIKLNAPLVHNITNYVVMNSTANALLAIGASPVMAHAKPEVEEFVAMSSSVVLNIGTLSKPWIESMELAAETAQKLKKPFVLDPVGNGATKLRTETVESILQYSPTVIRGNGSEILAINHSSANTKGVDSLHSSQSALDSAKLISSKFSSVVVVSGETDYIIHKERMASVQNGHPIMTKVTGMGCSASALVGAFLGVEPDPFLASLFAMIVMGVCGEVAEKSSKGPGSFFPAFLDTLYHCSEWDWKEKIKATVLSSP